MYRFILIIFALLMFILSVDGTIALRYLLIVSLLAGLLINITKNMERLKILTKSKELRLILISLFIFAFFILFHSIFISHEPLWSLSEFKSHIIYPYIYFFVGILLANYANQSKQISKELIITVVFFSMFAHILFIDLVAIDNIFQRGVLLSRYGGLMDSPVLANYLTNILLAMIIAEIVYRLRVNQKVLMVSNGTLYLLLVACIFSTFIERLRLGDISLIFLGLGSAIVFLYHNKEYSNNRKRQISAALIFILTVPLIFNISTDPRWSRLIETIPVAIDSAEDDHWIDRRAPKPVTESGHVVTGSNYSRIVYAIKSAKFIIDEPMGVGFGISDVLCKDVKDVSIPKRLQELDVPFGWTDEIEGLLSVGPITEESGNGYSRIRQTYFLKIVCSDELTTSISGEAILEGFDASGQWIGITDSTTIEHHSMQFLEKLTCK